jgi:thioredoxin-dependent peroxiredoxin
VGSHGALGKSPGDHCFQAFGRRFDRRFWDGGVGLRGLLCDWTSRADARNLVRVSMATSHTITLKAGDAAPDFSAPTSGGGRLSLAELRGKHVVLYFYPKDDTPGCTKEACGIRDAYAEFERRGVVVLGVSTDSAASHDKFVKKFKLPFRLLADETREIVTAYGVWGEKMFMGRRYQGTHRVSFWIGPDGKIRKVWPQVKPELHAAEILHAIET